MKIKSLTLRISIVVTIMTLFVLLATLLTVYTIAISNHTKEAEQETHFRLESVVEKLSKIQTSVEQAANYSIPAIKANVTDTVAVMGILNNIVESNEFVNCAALAYAPNRLPGKEYCMPTVAKEGYTNHYFNEKDLNGSYIYNFWYIVPELEGMPVWTDPYYNLFFTPVASYAVPIINKDNELEGVLTLAVELTNLNKMLTINEADKHNASSVSIILDRNTTFLTTRDESLIMNETFFTLAERHNDTIYSHIGHEILSNHDGESVVTINGEKSVLTWRVLPNLGWTAMVITPSSEVFASANALTYTTIIVALLAAFLAIIILYFSVRRALRPFKQLKSATHMLGEGKYDVQLPYRLTERPDEIGDLGREFMRMEKAVKKNIDDLEEERERLRRSYEMLSTLMHNVVGHLRLPINNLVNYNDVLETMLIDNEDSKAIQQEAKEASMTILQQFNQLNELANLISSKANNDESSIVLSSEDFVSSFLNGVHQLEQRYLLKVNTDYQDKRKIDIRCNTHILEKLLYELMLESAKVSKSDTIGLHFMFSEDMSALRIAIAAKTPNPIPEKDKPNFFVRFAKEKVNAYATSELLPLYICYKIAEHIGVNLYVEPGFSKDDPANVFIIDIPRAKQ